ncbi:hypothetical protein DASC09_043040 [Saccharomycopsis crataegensis]|uniref:Uncharacterized protein n=1 Tax=Saccharomycopsis crataegensis TaxID=43959 RepID=A0AAV5QQI9_9ASCO|nr:hypothetical protein DASC09_043040 [Saccharomycopsis crataegensis]
MLDCIHCRERVSSYDEFDEAVLGKLKIYAPDLIYLDIRNLYGSYRTPLSILKRLPPLDKSLEIGSHCRGFETTRKLQDLVWIFVSYGIGVDAWSNLLLLYLTPELKHLVGVRLRIKGRGSMNNQNNQTTKQIESFHAVFGDCLVYSLLEVILLAEELPCDTVLPTVKKIILRLTKGYFSFPNESRSNFEKSLMDAKSCLQLRQVMGKPFQRT